MKSLKDFTESERATVLKFTQILAGEMPTKAHVDFDLDMNDNQSEAQVTEQVNQLVERRKTSGGRSYRDNSEEGVAIREQVRKYLRSRKQLQGHE